MRFHHTFPRASSIQPHLVQVISRKPVCLIGSNPRYFSQKGVVPHEVVFNFACSTGGGWVGCYHRGSQFLHPASQRPFLTRLGGGGGGDDDRRSLLLYLWAPRDEATETFKKKHWVTFGQAPKTGHKTFADIHAEDKGGGGGGKKKPQNIGTEKSSKHLSF